MAPVIKHPKSDQAASVRMRHLIRSVEDDRDRAIAALGLAISQLETLSARCDAPFLKAIATECGIFLNALRSVNPANIEDDLNDQLEMIKRRLLLGLSVIEKLNASLSI